MVQRILSGMLFISILCSFHPWDKKKPVLPKEFVYVPPGTFTPHDDDEPYYFSTWTRDTSKRITVPGFYMSKFEVSNKQYREFFTEMKKTLTMDALEKIIVDSSAWHRYPANYPSEFWLANSYFSHPALNNHPVVNISYEGAIRYCQWLQEKIQLGNKDRFIISVSLPTRNQWVYAVGPGPYPYPWRSQSLIDKNGKRLCNYRYVEESVIVMNPASGKPEIKEDGHTNSPYRTVPVQSFPAFGFGFYNTSGNVSEMIQEKGICVGGSWNHYGGDVTTQSFADYTGPSPCIGFRPIITVTEKR